MNILVIGSGGREHAIIRKIKENPKATNIFAAPGNGGISKDAECIPVKACDIDGMCALCREKQIDFAGCCAGRPAGSRNGRRPK